MTRCDPVHLHPVSHELELTDKHGQHYELRGTIVASCPAGYWPNANIYIALVKWECQGLTGWGDSQECRWTDFVRGMLGRPEVP